MLSLDPILICSIGIPSKGIVLEASKAKLDGPILSTKRSGYLGAGYATNLEKSDAKISWRFKSQEGVYLVRLRYASASPKGFVLSLNGLKSSGMLLGTHDKFQTLDLGKVELKDGENEAVIERGWGNFDVNDLLLLPAKSFPALKRPPMRLSDPQASMEAKNLYSSLLSRYGTVTGTGQYETGIADTGETKFIVQKTGKVPFILGGDLSDYSPSRTAHVTPVDLVPQWISAAKMGQAVTLSWHWNAPTDLLNDPKHQGANGQIEDDSWNYGFYTRASTFDLAAVLKDPAGPKYRLLLRDIDAIATQLRRLQDAHIPVLWRPLHEAEGGWFWWGAKGADPCKNLWRLMFHRMTQVDGLHNLIWVWNSADPTWYPGDDVVDVMTIDRYPDDRRDTLSSDWDSLLKRFNGRKPLALAEFPGAFDLDRASRLGIRWMYFVSWYGGVGPRTTPPDLLQETYRSDLARNSSPKF